MDVTDAFNQANNTTPALGPPTGRDVGRKPGVGFPFAGQPDVARSPIRTARRVATTRAAVI